MIENSENRSLLIRNNAIDGLRAVAVIAVILYHLSVSLLPHGFLGVDIFFVISGYVVCSSLLRRPKESLGRFFAGFYSRRILRIYPALIACLLVTGLFAAMFIPDSFVLEKTSATGLWAFLGLSNFELLARRDAYFGVAAEFNPYLHTWSLAVEEQFYLIFPFFIYVFLNLNGSLLFYRRLVSWILMALAILASMVMFYIQTNSTPMTAFYMLPSRYWELGSGALLAALHIKGVLRSGSQYMDFLFAATGLTGVVYAIGLVSYVQVPIPRTLIAVAGSLLIIQGVSDGSTSHWIQRFLSQPLCVSIGRISYSLYLWHWPIIVLMKWTVGIDTLLLVCVAVLLTVVVAVLSYHFLEIPTQRLAKYFPSRFPIAFWSRGAWDNGFCKTKSLTVQSSVLLFGVLSILGAQQAFRRIGQTDRFKLSVTTYRPGIATGWHNLELVMPGDSFKKRTLFVAGDSHAGCYRGMAELLEEQTGLKSVVLSKLGIKFGSLVHSQNEIDREFEQVVLSQIKATSNPGDVVLLTSLRVKRLCGQWSLFDRSEVIQERDSPEAEVQRRQAVTEGIELIKKLQSFGLIVIIEAPKPILPSPPFRCSDWFNKMNPIAKGGLSIERDFLLVHRSAAMKSIGEVIEVLPDTIVWDPFFVLCPGEVFEAFDKKKPLLFDGDHITAYANEKLYPSFRKLLNEIWRNQDNDGSKIE